MLAAGCTTTVTIVDTDPGGSNADFGGLGPDTAIDWQLGADNAVSTMLLHYWMPSAPYLGNVSPSDGATTGYWTYAQALDTVLDGVERTGGVHFTGWIEALYDVQNTIGWSRDFYDDEDWMTLALMRAYDQNHTAKYLDEAEQLYADIEAAWDTTCCGSHPGGIWWDRPHTIKATASNAGPVIAGARLAERTGNSAYLAFAEKVYAYWLANMVDPTSHAVYDHISPDGTRTAYNFTYNDGLMVGAGVALYTATHDATYLQDANAIAGYMLAHQTVKTTDGLALNDGTNTSCASDCQQFKGIGYRYLTELAQVDPQPQYQALLASSAKAIWNLARAPSGLFATDWAGPTTASSTIASDSSAAMAINLYAESVGPYDRSDNVHEAEDGVVHAIALEAIHGAFGGWGYLAGWNRDGQWVDFTVDAPSAGSYQLSLRYSAAAGAASREIYINGAVAVADHSLAATGSWDDWKTSTVNVGLAAGANTISVIYAGSLGSHNYVNLDWIAVAK
jgi:predicted alpha-1,6-mannanase (GH76 family)